MSSRYEFAGFGRRLLATIIDAIILAIVTAILSSILQMMGVLSPLENVENIEALQAAVLKQQLFSNIFGLIVTVILWMKWAGTPGKRLLKLKVLDAKTGNKISFGQAILRYFAYILSTLPLFLGFFWIIWDKQKQSFHDKIAKTVVVIDNND
ncbi:MULTISPECIES: RDD family protein [unclassified Acinetobacter]|uniref:RDD family protein n=1 Tax=unclassified Acinetobacter TaxID=196816 RepID=UPI0035BB23F2